MAVELYNGIRDLPIIDFHNHLNPKEIYENKPYNNISSIWLEHDHYKWRLMRNSGVEEEYITGTKTEFEKFENYCNALEKAYLNPLYHWSHMELSRYFNVNDLIKKANIKSIYQTVNDKLKSSPKGPRDFLDEMNVKIICTTDDLLSNLEYHKLISLDEGITLKVLPTFRPDRLFKINDEVFNRVIKGLEETTRTTITGISSLMKALSIRLDFFVENGCRFSDHGISHLNYHLVSKSQASRILKRRILGEKVSKVEVEMLQSYILVFLIKEYGRRNIVMQLHIGALRNMNTKMFSKLGPDSGYDSIGDDSYIEDLNMLLSDASHSFDLPETIIYNLNPRDNEAVASTCGNFSENSNGNVQIGAPWWFNDHYNGIIRHLNVYSEYLNISLFKGMLTDSRSYLSFVRHDYFRRILSNYFANKMLEGHIPMEIEEVKQTLKAISYENVYNSIYS